MNNSEIIRKSLNDFLKNHIIINGSKGLNAAGVEMISHAFDNREYEGFTGNTPTSLSYGLFIEKSLDSIVSLGDSLDEPVFRKLKRGERRYLTHPWEGYSRKRTGVPQTDNLSGQDSAANSIRNIVPTYEIEVLVATGTEYSEYLEKVHHLNVLTNTFAATKGGLGKNEIIQALHV